MVVTVTTFAQTATTETVLRTLGLPPEYAIVDGFITDYKIERNLVIVQNIDRSKSLKVVSPTGKVTYTNAPTTWGYEIREKRDELTNGGTYLPNFIAMRIGQPGDNINPDNIFQIKQDRIASAGGASWIGASSLTINQLNSSLIVLIDKTELGSSQNVIQRTFVKTVNGISYYKNPVDYLGRPIAGDTIWNNGVPASAMRISYDKRIVAVTMITNTKIGSGLWSTANPVWSRGVKTSTHTSTAYVPVAELPGLFGHSIESLEDDLHTEIFCTPLNKATHITSTSTEIITAGNVYKGITYYSGVDASITKPSGKITSYNKPYPGHVQRWLIKQWNQDGTVAQGTSSRGEVLMVTFQSSDNSSVVIVPGSKTEYNAASNTITYDASNITELWYQFEELPAQGKNWSGETIVKLQ